MNITDFNESDCKWIWALDKEKQPNQYVEFRKEFLWKNGKSAKLFLSCDSDYAVWVNGEFVNCGQYDDYPDYKVYDELDLSTIIKPGKNLFSILVYHQGEGSGNYIPKNPGLIYELKGENQAVCSDETTHCRRSCSYQNGKVDKNQIGFNFIYDARQSDDWNTLDYKEDGSWSASVQQNLVITREFVKRPISKLKIVQETRGTIIAQGIVKRGFTKEMRISRQMYRDFLSARTKEELFISSNSGLTVRQDMISQEGDGIYFIIDLGEEMAGILSFELEAAKDTLIDIGYGEHLIDLRVRTSIEERNFACRYYCRQGEQSFEHYFLRFGCRYLQIHILSEHLEQLRIKRFGLKSTEYPIALRGSFSCDDLLHEKIYETAVHTLKLCMHEHYEDCPWREQALYAMDSRNQALCGYYCFGEYDFPKASFELLAKGLRKDGYLNLCAPGEVGVTIPVFSLAWILEMKEYYLYSGDLDFIEKNVHVMTAILDHMLTMMEDGLVWTPIDPEYWNFYEWTENLSGEPIFRKEKLPSRKDALLNLFLKMALDAAAYLLKYAGENKTSEFYKEQAEQIRNSFHKAFWDDSQRVYKTYLSEEKMVVSELVQTVAVCADVVPENIRSELLHTIAYYEHHLVKCSLSMSLFRYTALLGCPGEYGELVENEIQKVWGSMLLEKATSFWETILGAADFNNAGSLCHGWSAIPVYIYYAYILGVQPVEPGFLKFRIRPVTGRIYEAKGTVPTPYGPIQVEWSRKSGELVIKKQYPLECTDSE